jgi:hypothetical protein
LRINIIYFFSTILLISCSDLGTNTNDTIIPIPKNRSVAEAQQLIVGHWEWVRTIDNGTTPWDDGLRIHIEFTARREAHLYRSDTIFSSASYFIFISPDSTSIILVIGNYVPCIFRVNEQFLVTDYRRDNGPVDLFKKRN